MDKLSHKQTKILKFIVSQYKKDKLVSINSLKEKFKNMYEIVQDINFLINQNYIVCSRDSCFRPLPKGRYYFEKLFKEYFIKLIFSLVIPIIISVVSAYFTSILTVNKELNILTNTTHNP